MRTLWIFRSNLRILEEYHNIKSLQQFENECHDFYLLMGLYYLENDVFDEVVVWRLTPEFNDQNIYVDIPDFILPNKKIFKQKFVNSFEDAHKYLYQFNYNKPDISFFRGGFREYDILTKKYKDELGLCLYLGAGRRITPRWGGLYDKILVESEEDLKNIPNSIPFYKSCNPNIFHMNHITPKYDICFVSNFSQQSYKGQEFFIKKVSESDYLKSLDIVHIGNKPEIGRVICEKYKVDNIKFAGQKHRTTIHIILNKSKFGLVCSNQKDGCPRVITEVLSVGTPLLIRDQTRLLNFYKEKGVVEFNDKNIEKKIADAFNNYYHYKGQAVENISRISLSLICDKNFALWKQ